MKFRPGHYTAVIRLTACLHFARRTTSLRVGGLADRLSYLAGLRRGGSGRAGTAGATARRTPTQTRHRTHLYGGRADSIHTATPDTTKQSRLCRDGVNWV